MNGQGVHSCLKEKGDPLRKLIEPFQDSKKRLFVKPLSKITIFFRAFLSNQDIMLIINRRASISDGEEVQEDELINENPGSRRGSFIGSRPTSSVSRRNSK